MLRRGTLAIAVVLALGMAFGAQAASATVRIVATVSAPLEVYVNSPGATATLDFPTAISGGELSRSGNTYTFTDTDYGTGIVDANLGEPALGLTVCYPGSASGSRAASYSVTWYDQNPETNEPNKHSVTGSLSVPGRGVGIGYATADECASRGTASADHPVARCDAYWVQPGHFLKVAAPGFLKNDSDPKKLKLTATVDQINFGVADHPYSYFGKTGKLEFHPNATPGGKPFVAEIEYHVKNSKGKKSKPTTIKIFIQPTKPPKAVLQGCKKPPKPKCDTGGGKHGFLKRVYDARVARALLPDQHFFKFETTVSYCYDGSDGKFKSGSGSAFGYVKEGIFTRAIELVGVTLDYNREKESAIATPHLFTAEGEFDLNLDILKLFDKLGLKKALEKDLGKIFEKKLARHIETEGYGAGFADFARKEADKAVLRFKVDLEDAHHSLYRKFEKLPGFLEKPLKKPFGLLIEKAEGKFEHALDTFSVQFGKQLAADEQASLSANEISNQAVEAALAAIHELTAVHVILWRPQYSLHIGSHGVKGEHISGIVTSFLTIKKE
jgi:hypothetical protein